MKMLSFYSIAAAALLACAPAAMAADAAPAIAVVNMQQILSDSTAAKSAHDQLETKSKSFQADITKKQDQLQKENQELGKQQSVLSKSAFEEKATAFRKKVTEAQKEMQTKRALLDNASARAGNEIQKTVSEIVSAIAKEKGFVAAIPTSQLIYADPKLDITSDVLTRLNQKLPKIDVKFDSSDDSSSKK